MTARRKRLLQASCSRCSSCEHWTSSMPCPATDHWWQSKLLKQRGNEHTLSAFSLDNLERARSAFDGVYSNPSRFHRKHSARRRQAVSITVCLVVGQQWHKSRQDSSWRAQSAVVGICWWISHSTRLDECSYFDKKTEDDADNVKEGRYFFKLTRRIIAKIMGKKKKKPKSKSFILWYGFVLSCTLHADAAFGSAWLRQHNTLVSSSLSHHYLIHYLHLFSIPDILGSDSFGTLKLEVGEQGNKTIAIAEELAALNPTPNPTYGWMGYGGGSPNDCKLQGKWKLKFTTAADATFPESPKRGKANTSQEIDATAGTLTNVVEFEKGKTRGFRVVVAGKATSDREIELTFQESLFFAMHEYSKRLCFPFQPDYFDSSTRFRHEERQANVDRTLKYNMSTTISECTRREKETGLYNRDWSKERESLCHGLECSAVL